MEQKDQTGLTGEKSILNVDAQKEIIDYSAKVRVRQSIKVILIVLPLIAIFVLALLYVVYKFTGIIT